ncbi:hypothetical protein ID866_12934, partial [Astraeus odoratus]
DVLGGSQPLDISHAGGEFQELAKQVLKTVQTSPHLSIQAFVKTLCDLQGVTF